MYICILYCVLCYVIDFIIVIAIIDRSDVDIDFSAWIIILNLIDCLEEMSRVL
jgi:uncharacterized membrane protein YhaH (DUF805 family)